MNMFAKLTTAAAIAGALAVPMATPSQAAWHHHHGGRGAAAAIGFGAGALVGAAAANAAYGPGYGYDNGYAYDSGYADPGYGSYAYDPGPAYDYAPVYRGRWSRSDMNAQQCTLSPGSVNYVPCDNNR
jgi:hypothetical protein